VAAGVAATLGARAGAPEAVPAVDLTELTLGAHTVIARTQAGGVAELTLEPKLEAASRRLLARARPFEGAVVVVDVKTGRVLAWAESRDGVITHARAPAASVFKLVTTAALFETERAVPNDPVCIPSGAHSGERGIEREHLEPPSHGAVCRPLSEALGFSRNAVFAQLATRHLLRTDLLETAERLGFNSEVPFDWPAAIGSLSVPYNDLEFARAATGFRGSTLSPLGGAYIAATIARGGAPVRLRLVARTDDYEAPEAPESLPRTLSPTTAYRLTRMMEVTVHSGTARSAFSTPEGRSLLPGIRVAGKTGTLRPSSSNNTTSWFVGFAPSRKPEVAVSVLLNNGPVWHNRAAEVARDVLRAYFRGRGVPGIADPLEPSEPLSRPR
jgi:cell division protein FtsI/penicillin-binding protein 2